MTLLPRFVRRRLSISRPRVWKGRGFRPALEPVEGRLLLSTMVANINGVSGVSGGSVWHYQDGSPWFHTGNMNVASVVDSRDQYGREELFARLNDGSIWSYTYATNTWANTYAHLDMMIANANGITGTANGHVYHYQNNGGWFDTQGSSMAALVASHNPSGQEELFARSADGSIWSFTYATNTWKNTGGRLDAIIANANGISGTASGYVWHYQDNGGWTYTQGWGVAALVDSANPFGREELFAQAYDGTIWSYTFATGAWKNTTGHLDTLTANVNGISGTINGYVWHYQDDRGWSYLQRTGIATLVDSRNAAGQEEMFAQDPVGLIWSYTFATGAWKNTTGHLD